MVDRSEGVRLEGQSRAGKGNNSQQGGEESQDAGGRARRGLSSWFRQGRTRGHSGLRVHYARARQGRAQQGRAGQGKAGEGIRQQHNTTLPTPYLAST